MRGWKNRAIEGIRDRVRRGQVQVTLKAAQELSDLGLGLRPSDLEESLLQLQVSNAVERVRSHLDGSWLYVFRTAVEDLVIYLKVTLHEDCVVISFHGYDEG